MPRRKEEQGRLGPDEPPRLENTWPEGRKPQFILSGFVFLGVLA
jgi:hypothetical protein